MTTKNHLRDIQDQIRTDDKVMAEARRRRNAVLRTAAGYPGMRTTFSSGSIAMGVANDPVLDADGGVIVDRRFYPKLGPDGDGELPAGIVGDLQDHVGPAVRETWERATVHKMKRGLTVRFHDPVVGDQDPYVDVVVAMDRKDAEGLWIPNLTSRRWDPSHPVKHVSLMAAGSAGRRRTRARVVRLAKAWNKQYSEPALSSFNIVALAYECVEWEEDIDDALFRFFDHSVRGLREGLTQDPAGVSAAVRLPLGKETAVKRLTKARDSLRSAIDADDPDEELQAMHELFWKYVPEPDGRSKRALAETLRRGSPRITTSPSVGIVGSMKPTSAYGD